MILSHYLSAFATARSRAAATLIARTSQGLDLNVPTLFIQA